MINIFKRNPKEEQEQILVRAMKETVIPLKIGISSGLVVESILLISWLINCSFSNMKELPYFIFYTSFVLISGITLLLHNVFAKDIKHDYRRMRVLHTTTYILLMAWATALTMVDSGNNYYFSFLVYATFAVVLPMLFYINRYVLTITLLVSQIALLLYCEIVLDFNFLLDTINFVIFSIFDDMAAVIVGYTKMNSIKREIIVDRLSNRDALTEMFNRQKLNSDAPDVFNENLTNKYELTSIMMDIDNFKSINDTFGHKKGDEVIQAICKVIKEEGLKANAHSYRYGGEEFLILGTNMSRNQAINLVESIQQKIKEVKIEDFVKEVTLSFGIYTKVPTKEDYIENYYSRADELLYISKNNGKNQYTFNGRENK